MKKYLAIARIDLLLASRNRSVLFFNYIFPLIFFFSFGELMDAEKGGAIVQVVTMVLILGTLGNGLFGAGMRIVQERDSNILRRFKVAPISPLPILTASMLTGLVSFLPMIAAVLVLAHFVYGMPVPPNLASLVVIVSVGVVAFRAVGLIAGAVVNSMQEASIVLQILYLPMLFLSGATFPVGMLPDWLQVAAQFMPATHLATALQGVFLRNEGLLENGMPVLAMLLTTAVATFVAMHLFRWEKEEKIRTSSKLWIVAAMAPFLLVGCYEAYSRDSVNKTRALYRQMRRSQTILIRDARIFTGDGKVIERGAVLIQDGKIKQVYEGSGPDPASVRAEAIEAAGKTLLPGLIDTHVHLTAPGGIPEDQKSYDLLEGMQRNLAAYLYCGVTAVMSAGDGLDSSLQVRRAIESGDKLGAELFACGPMITAEGGHGTEYFENLPPMVKAMAEKECLRLPKSAEEAQRQVAALKSSGVNGIKAILESGWAGALFPRLDLSILRAAAQAARQNGLPVAVHTGEARDVADAVATGADSIEHGSARDLIPESVFAEILQKGVAYDSTLSVVEAIEHLRQGRVELLNRSLAQQAAPAGLLQHTAKLLAGGETAGLRRRMQEGPYVLETAAENLRRAHRAGVSLVAGSDAGNLLVLHGPGIHRELQLWVGAGIPAATALEAATWNAARRLGAGDRIGRIATGYEADLLLVDGNPLEDISATERISHVFFKGENIRRAALFEQE